MKGSILLTKTTSNIAHHYWSELVYEELLNKRARFGFSAFEGANLRALQSKVKSVKWTALTIQERECWSNTAFLLDTQIGDYFIYLDLPRPNSYVIVAAGAPYEFTNVWDPNEIGDFRHLIQCEIVNTFTIEDSRLPSRLASKLRTEASWQKIELDRSFQEFLLHLGSRSQLRNKQAFVTSAAPQLDDLRMKPQVNETSRVHTEPVPTTLDLEQHYQSAMKKGYQTGVQDLYKALTADITILEKIVANVPALNNLAASVRQNLQSNAHSKVRTRAREMYADMISMQPEPDTSHGIESHISQLNIFAGRNELPDARIPEVSSNPTSSSFRTFHSETITVNSGDHFHQISVTQSEEPHTDVCEAYVPMPEILCPSKHADANGNGSGRLSLSNPAADAPVLVDAGLNMNEHSSSNTREIESSAAAEQYFDQLAEETFANDMPEIPEPGVETIALSIIGADTVAIADDLEFHRHPTIESSEAPELVPYDELWGEDLVASDLKDSGQTLKIKISSFVKQNLARIKAESDVVDYEPTASPSPSSEKQEYGPELVSQPSDDHLQDAMDDHLQDEIVDDFEIIDESSVPVTDQYVPMMATPTVFVDLSTQNLIDIDNPHESPTPPAFVANYYFEEQENKRVEFQSKGAGSDVYPESITPGLQTDSDTKNTKDEDVVIGKVDDQETEQSEGQSETMDLSEGLVERVEIVDSETESQVLEFTSEEGIMVGNDVSETDFSIDNKGVFIDDPDELEVTNLIVMKDEAQFDVDSGLHRTDQAAPENVPDFVTEDCLDVLMKAEERDDPDQDLISEIPDLTETLVEAIDNLPELNPIHDEDGALAVDLLDNTVSIFDQNLFVEEIDPIVEQDLLNTTGGTPIDQLPIHNLTAVPEDCEPTEILHEDALESDPVLDFSDDSEDDETVDATEAIPSTKMEIEIQQPTGIRDTEKMRKLPRNYLMVRLPVQDVECEDCTGYLRDITECGAQIAGIDTQVGQVRKFLIQADEYMDVEPFVFTAECRWHKDDEQDIHSAGFQIRHIDEPDMVQLKKMIGFLSLGTEVFPDPFDRGREAHKENY